MTIESYPTGETSPDDLTAAGMLTRLATNLGTDVAMLMAVAGGSIYGAEIIGEHPHGGSMGLRTLAHWESLIDVDGFCDSRSCCRCDEARRAAVSPRPPRSGLYLYRLWTEDGRLLYVGVSSRLRARLASHRRRWPDLWTDATWEEHPDEISMLTAEATAIADEDPAMNVRGIR